MKLNVKRFLFFGGLLLGILLVALCRFPLHFQSSLNDLFPVQINGKNLPKEITGKYADILNVVIEADSFEISGVALGPDYVRKGYGREIMEALEEAARSEGALKIISSNRQGNVASRELQKACGYVFEGLSEEKEDPYTGEKYFLENNVKYL